MKMKYKKNNNMYAKFSRSINDFQNYSTNIFDNLFHPIR